MAKHGGALPGNDSSNRCCRNLNNLDVFRLNYDSLEQTVLCGYRFRNIRPRVTPAKHGARKDGYGKGCFHGWK
jgi:hypothetical protein